MRRPAGPGGCAGQCWALRLCLFVLLQDASGFFGWSAAATNVVLFPVMVLSGLMLMRMARLLNVHARTKTDEQVEETYRDRLARLMARAIMALAIVAPLLAAVGYFSGRAIVDAAFVEIVVAVGGAGGAAAGHVRGLYPAQR